MGTPMTMSSPVAPPPLLPAEPQAASTSVRALSRLIAKLFLGIFASSPTPPANPAPAVVTCNRCRTQPSLFAGRPIGCTLKLADRFREPSDWSAHGPRGMTTPDDTFRLLYEV